jgi:hypothetical protein
VALYLATPAHRLERPVPTSCVDLRQVVSSHAAISRSKGNLKARFPSLVNYRGNRPSRHYIRQGLEEPVAFKGHVSKWRAAVVHNTDDGRSRVPAPQKQQGHAAEQQHEKAADQNPGARHSLSPFIVPYNPELGSRQANKDFQSSTAASPWLSTSLHLSLLIYNHM